MNDIRSSIAIIKEKLRTSDIAKRMATGAFWSFTGTALAKFIVLVAGIACAHVLGKKEYGEFGMVRSTINMFVVFGFAGLGLTATKYISEFRTHQKERIASIYLLTNGFAIVTGVIVTSFVLIFAPYLADHTLHASYLTPAIRIGGLLLFVTVINGAQQGTLSGFEDFKSIAINTLIGSIAESIFMLLGGWLYGVTGAILGFGCGFIALYITNYFAIRKNLQKSSIKISKTSFQKTDLKLLYKFSLPAALSSFMVAPVLWIIRAMLVQKDGFEELAVFEAAYQWRMILLFIPSAVSQIALPILSSIANGNQHRFRRVLNINLFLNVSIALILSLLVILSSPYIMRMYGKDYSDNYPLIILAASTIFSSAATVIGISNQSKAKMWISFSFNFVWAAELCILTYVYLNAHMGASGVALAILSAYVLHSIAQIVYVASSRNG